jgi:hypothetical protein
MFRKSQGGYLPLVFGIKQSGKHGFFIHLARLEGREHLQRDIVCFSGIRTRTKQRTSFLKKLPERSQLLGFENA